MMPSFLTVFTMPETSCPGRGRCQGVWACAALVLVWVSVLLPTPRTTAHATATALGTTVVGARASTDMGSSTQQPQAQRREGALQRIWSLADIQAAPTTASQGDAALDTPLQRSLQVIQGHDAYDAELLSAIALVGHVGDTRAIPPLIEAWSQRTARQLEAIQKVIEKLQVHNRSERDEAWFVAQVIDQILDDINAALESLGIERARLLHLNRDAVQQGSTKAIAILVKYHDTEAIPLLLTLLKKGDDKVGAYNAALAQLGAEQDAIFHANIHALAGWNVHATLAILGTHGDRRAIGPIRRLLDRSEPVPTEAKAVLKQLGASWYDQRSDAERLGLWLGALILGRALWRACRLLWHPRRRSMSPQQG